MGDVYISQLPRNQRRKKNAFAVPKFHLQEAVVKHGGIAQWMVSRVILGESETLIAAWSLLDGGWILQGMSTRHTSSTLDCPYREHLQPLENLLVCVWEMELTTLALFVK